MSDTPSPGPRAMERQEYERRSLMLVNHALIGTPVDVRQAAGWRDEAIALWGDDMGPRMLSILMSPPLVCPDCGDTFRSSLPLERCHECAEKKREDEIILRHAGKVCPHCGERCAPKGGA